MLIGSHQSITKSVDLSIQRALADGCECLQIFTKNNNRWEGKPISAEEAGRFRDGIITSGLKVCAHSCYLINLASFDNDTYGKSVNCYRDELSRCDRLGIPYYVMHPGAHTGRGVEAGVRRIAESIDAAYDRGFECMTLLEMTAGQGTGIGHTIEEMLAIIEAAHSRDNIGICLDSAHIYAAGYDIKGDYEGVVKQMFASYGSRIKVFHLNDSKKPLASRVDRHELIGRGEIGADFFKKAVNDSRFSDILGILETPVSENYKKEIELLKSYRES